MFLISSCSCLCLIHWSQVLNWEWGCSWSSAGRRCSNYIWVINNFVAYYGAPHIKGMTVYVFLIHKKYHDDILWKCWHDVTKWLPSFFVLSRHLKDKQEILGIYILLCNCLFRCGCDKTEIFLSILTKLFSFIQMPILPRTMCWIN